MPPLINSLPVNKPQSLAASPAQVQKKLSEQVVSKAKTDTAALEKKTGKAQKFKKQKTLLITLSSIIAAGGLLLSLNKLANNKALQKEARDMVDYFENCAQDSKNFLDNIKQISEKWFHGKIDILSFTKESSLKNIENLIKKEKNIHPAVIDGYLKQCNAVNKNYMKEKMQDLKLDDFKAEMQALIDARERLVIFDADNLMNSNKTIKKNKKFQAEIKLIKNNFEEKVNEIKSLLDAAYYETLASCEKISEETINCAQELLQKLEKLK